MRYAHRGWLPALCVACILLGCSRAPDRVFIRRSAASDGPTGDAGPGGAGTSGSVESAANVSGDANGVEAPSQEPIQPGMVSTDLPPPVACRDRTDYQARGQELEILLLMDNSLSMQIPSLGLAGSDWTLNDLLNPDPAKLAELHSPWDAAVDEIEAFIGDPRSEGIGVGLRLFAGGQCDPQYYADPDVAIEPLPGNITTLSATLNAALPSAAGNATRVALEGATSYLRSRADSAPVTPQLHVVLITDGSSSPQCQPNQSSDIAEVAAEALVGDPPIRTWVLTIGIPFGENLDLVARQGGTERALIVDVGSPGQLTDHMATIRDRGAQLLPCAYALPEGVEADPSRINLELSEQGSDPVTIPQLQSADTCAGTDGWYFDPEDELPIQVCPDTCNHLKMTAGTVSVITGCPAVE